jgi:GT2 family glycosyltransferase/MoaA/NifB/PqqE/SkfB family radical SAM enzyme
LPGRSKDQESATRDRGTTLFPGDHSLFPVEIDLGVYIVFYEKLGQTIECIESVLASGVDIYVFNNGSSASSRQALGRFCDDYRQIKISDSDVNLGTAVGRNYLVTHTSEEWLLCLDNDVVVRTRDWLRRFARHISLDGETEVFIPKLFNAGQSNHVERPSIRIDWPRVFQDVKVTDDSTNVFPGGAAFIARKLFDRLGLYDEEMFVGFEDQELCIRAILSGNPVKARLIHDIELIHEHRRVENSVDRKTVLTRYDSGLLDASFNRINEKHNIIFEYNWRPGAAEVAGKMAAKRRSSKIPWREWPSNSIDRVVEISHALNIPWKQWIPDSVRRTAREIMRERQRYSPMDCVLFMTNNRNFKHPGCYGRKGSGRPREMSLATVQRMLSLYPSINAFFIAGFGEPTLCPSFADIVNFLRKRKKFVIVTTNGANPGKLLELAYEPNYISITLKDYDEESCPADTGIATHQTIAETFSRLKARFNNVGFSYMLKRTNYEDLGRVIALCDDLQPAFLNLTNYLIYGEMTASEVQKIITVRDVEIIEYIDAACDDRDYIKSKPVYLDYDNLKYNCDSYNYLVNVDGDGNIGGCQRQIPPGPRFGNIFRDDDPYNSSEMCKQRRLYEKAYYAHTECRFCFENWKSRT